ncbi:concanavalin A-like lectin/glucanase domain-containing protein [Xylariomycetidae sp. FL0641]|nr:concanavalin A-like lectin/glucanase domain-containing protein [Xylariomycetidae sp. FL0641]
MRFQQLLAALPLAASVSASPTSKAKRATTTVIPTTSFDEFDSYWSYNYPWGTDHNGGAHMDESQVSVADGALTLTATPTEGLGTVESGGETIQLNYLSGTVYAQQIFTVEEGGGYDFSAEFMATTTYGTWPAFWLNAASGWPPEIDMAEWKGSGLISFNTFNTSSQVDTHDVDYPDETEWHSIKAQLRDHNNGDVQVKFFMDDVEQTTQYAAGYVGAGMYLIIDLQMEGSSGSPGPDYDVTFSTRNLEVISYNP